MNLLTKQLNAVIEDITEEISLLSNTSAFIMQFFEDVSWAGFYLNKHDELILGPFQGKVACTNIQIGKGVCGTAASINTTQLVDDVHKFPGHIACDANSNSEIVVPINVNGKLYGVLDLDSTSFSRFDTDDQIILEEMVSCIETHLTRIANT